MNIWILNHYAVPQKYYYLARSYNFAKQLIAKGQQVTIFAASSVHNSNINLITDGRLYTEIVEDDISYVLFRSRQYSGSGKDRIINHIDVAIKMAKHCPQFTQKYGKPDVIFASAGQSLTLVAGICLAKKMGIKCVSEVTDLWPESFVAYGLISKKNPLLKLLYAGERWIYKKSDDIIFSMEGGRDYIIEKGWDTGHGGPVDLNKVHHINNGVDLEVFDYNKEHYQIDDPDLEDPDTFKVVYTGSVRRVNNLGLLLDAAKEVTNPRVKFLIWGDGDERAALEKRIKEESITNVVFKGRVDKKYVPYIVSHADLNFIHGVNSSLMRFGISPNKLFDYFAAGKPVLMDFKANYNPALNYSTGISCDTSESIILAEAFTSFVQMQPEQYEQFCHNARIAAAAYDFSTLTEKLIHVIDQLKP